MESTQGEGSLGYDDPVAQLARDRFKVNYLFPIQRFVIQNILEVAGTPSAGSEGDSGEEDGEAPVPRQIVILPTGAGKSLCFQLPALLLEGPSVVIYPILALMEDQRRRLESLGIPHVLLRGGQSSQEREKARNRLKAGEAKIVITNPETLRGREILEILERLGTAQVAVDEAHCVSEWGESFRPAYLELGPLIARLAPRALSAFTATASPTVLAAVARHLFAGGEYRLLIGDPDRPMLSYAVVPSLSRNRTVERLAKTMRRPLIVFASSRRKVEFFASLLGERLAATPLKFYHAGLTREEKQAVAEWFFQSGDGILIATCAYGLGVDKKDIRSVIHADLPESVEAYLQEAGRAGRDGLPARAVLILAPDEGSRVRNEETAERRLRREAFLAYAHSQRGCRREGLLRLLGHEGDVVCSGCDRCEGSAQGDYEGAEEIETFLKANPRRFKQSEVVLRLGERGQLEPPLVPGTGLCAEWRREDIADAVSAFLSLGRARARGKRIWQGRLELNPRIRGIQPPSRQASGAPDHL